MMVETMPDVGKPLGEDRLLTVQDVAGVMEVNPVTASKIMSETGKAIYLHRRKYVLLSALIGYLHEREAM